MSQLLVRPALNDHKVIGDLVARSPVPTIRRLRPPIGQLVLDAHIAQQRPAFATAASDAGVPVLVDPLTPLLQSAVDPRERWVGLPFAQADPLAAEAIDVAGLVESCIQFQLEVGATKIIAPYLYCSDLDDPAFAVSQQLLRDTVAYVAGERLGLPVVAVLCVQLQSFGRQAAISGGVGRYMELAAELGVSAVGLCLSPLGAPQDSYQKLSAMVRLSMAAIRDDIDVLAWRQGVYGPALSALGFDGYETGIGLSEHANIPRLQYTRRPRERSSGGAVPGLYIEPLGRSLIPRVATCLLGSIEMRARVVCEDEGCCASSSDMIDNRRLHAVRARARFLDELNEQPHRRWRLNHVAQHATTGVTVARLANQVLATNGMKDRIGDGSLVALARIARELSHAVADDQTA